ncbi:MAG: hypothetical protein OHK0012_12370 [Synechococcales cyanobacterium]
MPHPDTIDIGTLITTQPGIHQGVPIIQGTGITVRRIALDYHHGLSAEEIVAEIPHLTRSQVYAALAFYFANQGLIDADIAFQEAEAARLEAEYTNPQPYPR